MSPPSPEWGDVERIAAELGDLSEVLETDVGDDRIEAQLSEEQATIQFETISSVADRQGNDSSGSRVFVVLSRHVFALDDGVVRCYDLDAEDRVSGLVRNLGDVLTGDAEGREVVFDEFISMLQEREIELFQTPKQVAEILAGWVMTDTTNQVLDIATGTGTLLEIAGEQGGSGSESRTDLAGVDLYPLACFLARKRLQDRSSVEIVQADFLEWDQLQESSSSDQELAKFDAVVGHPPMGHLRHRSGQQREQIQEWYRGRGRSLDAVFVAKAVRHLAPGGRGAFVISKAALRDGLLEHLKEECAVHRLIELPANTFDEGFTPVILTVVKKERDAEARETGVGTFNRVELPANARGLFEQPLDGILENRYNTYDAEIVGVAHADLDGDTALRLLSTPSVYSVLRSDGFERLGTFAPEIDVGSGTTSGDNEFFHFDEAEKEQVGIDDRFFRSLIKELPEDTFSITADDIDQYVLDLQPYVEDMADGLPSTDDLIDHLQQEGYEGLADYLRRRDHGQRRQDPSYLLRYRGSIQNPDLVLPEFFDEPRCYAVEVDEVLFDSTVIGIQTASEELRTAVHRLLNTPVYTALLQTFAAEMNMQWYRLNLKELRDLPVSRAALTGVLATKTDVFFPPEDENDLVGLNQTVIEACEQEEDRQAVRRYMASVDDFAWSWFLTLPEVERFQELWEEDQEAARDFVLERFDERLLDDARETFNTLEFFEHREELLHDLLMEFEEGHYRGFLAGITLQFEGVLTDLVTAVGGDVNDENGMTEFQLPGENRPEPKSLNNLISAFFDGLFSTFLDQTVRPRRNDIAHGDVIENDRELAVHFFIAFYALCYASLAEYNKFTESDLE